MRDTNAHTGKPGGQLIPVASRHVIVRQARFGRANASSLTEAGLCLSSRRSSLVVAHDPTTSLADAALCQAPIRSCVTGCRRHSSSPIP